MSGFRPVGLGRGLSYGFSLSPDERGFIGQYSSAPPLRHGFTAYTVRIRFGFPVSGFTAPAAGGNRQILFVSWFVRGVRLFEDKRERRSTGAIAEQMFGRRRRPCRESFHRAEKFLSVHYFALSSFLHR
jgi:hypothetical protein